MNSLHSLCVFVFLNQFLCSQCSSDCDSLVASLTPPPQSSNMASVVNVNFEDFSDFQCEAKVVFYKHKSMAQKYATPWTNVSLGDMSVLRLSYGLDYQFMVYTRPMDATDEGFLLTNSTISIPESAWPYLTGRDSSDEGFVTSITGIPTWELLAIDVDAALNKPYFVGFVMIDNEGDIVWLWNVSNPLNKRDINHGTPSHVIDQFDNYSFALQIMVFEAPLETISPLGEVLSFYDFEEVDHNCLLVTHEARIVSDDVVLTFKQNMGTFDGWDVPIVGDSLMAWNGVTGAFDELYNMFDYINTNSTAYEQLYYDVYCNNQKVTVLDWSHANTASISEYDGSYIVSLRALSTVCSFKPLPYLGGINWCISSEQVGLTENSDFTFENELDEFFGQHSVYQLSNGNLLMYDNSEARVEGGYAGGGNSSRGIEYSLDFETMTASVVWEYPVSYTNHEGSNQVIKPSSGSKGGDDDDDVHKLIFVPVSGGEFAPTPTGRATTTAGRAAAAAAASVVAPAGGGVGVGGQSVGYEVDSSGEWVSTVMTNFWFDNPFRGTPFNTLNGEHRV